MAKSHPVAALLRRLSMLEAFLRREKRTNAARDVARARALIQTAHDIVPTDPPPRKLQVVKTGVDQYALR